MDRRARVGCQEAARGLSLAAVVVVLGAVGVAGCGPYGDGAAAMRAHRKEVERRTRGMRRATSETPRGRDLAGEELVRALSGRSLVFRYGSFPGGRRGSYVLYRYYRPDGGFVVADNWLHGRGELDEGDRWTVEGPRLCVLQQSHSQRPSCYRLARAEDGTLQFYVDDPDEPYHGLLTTSTREILDGPPPKMESRFATGG